MTHQVIINYSVHEAHLMLVCFLIIGKLMSVEVVSDNNSVCLLICQYHLVSCGNH